MPTVKKTARKATKKKAAAKRPAKSRKGVIAVDEGPPAEPGTSTLVVVESPAKAKTIGKYLGRGYRVRATIGHVRDLPEKKIGIDIENGFEPEYVTIPGKEKTLTELKNVARDSREVLLATDPDREGEAISWHVREILKARRVLKKDVDVKRVVFNAVTRDAVLDAFRNPREIDDELVEAYLARRALD
ncbi:MAG: toprim domain-containing protein, partial [Gemmatimonadaceae bacterium]